MHSDGSGPLRDNQTSDTGGSRFELTSVELAQVEGQSDFDTIDARDFSKATPRPVARGTM